MDDDDRRDELRRFVERFAVILTESGMPRMPSRVFALLLADDAARFTAGELAGRLGVSPAAISGAVRYLMQTGLLVRDREPGARSDHYHLRDDFWYEMYVSRLPLLERWEELLAEGADQLGDDRPGGARLRESQRFMAFMRADLGELVERWRRIRDAD
jgi:DNA-binding transcriptional regulator GbsR (MarR family)